jgi:hypothetical protein
MGEILSKETVDFLKNAEIRKAVRDLVEKDEESGTSKPVQVQFPKVSLRIVST